MPICAPHSPPAHAQDRQQFNSEENPEVSCESLLALSQPDFLQPQLREVLGEVARTTSRVRHGRLDTSAQGRSGPDLEAQRQAVHAYLSSGTSAGEDRLF